jgi:hypothetical protein
LRLFGSEYAVNILPNSNLKCCLRGQAEDYVLFIVLLLFRPSVEAASRLHPKNIFGYPETFTYWQGNGSF